jgi:prepilin-type N-terminal cleavage/methylation domain-containing protein
MNRKHAAMTPQPARISATMRRHRQAGFSLLELSVVLVIIGLIVGAVTIGKDVQRNATYQRIASDFVQGWAVAYDNFYSGTGRPPGDSPTVPTGIVNGGLAAPRPELCGDNLMNAMLAAGVALPTGRAEGAADRYVYLDSNGNPQEVSVCFTNVQWSESGASVGTYVSRPRNVMVLRGLTPALATLLDSSLDTHVDATFGNFRERVLNDARSNNITANHPGLPWSMDDRWALGAGGVAVNQTAAPRDESQVALVDAYLKMTR